MIYGGIRVDYGYFDVMKMRKAADAQRIVPHSDVTGRFPSETPLAMAYVPYQTFEKVYESDTALCRGTLFPELDFPLESEGGYEV